MGSSGLLRGGRVLGAVAAAILLADAAGCASAPRAHVPVLLTTDTGAEVDDQWALAHLLLAADEGEIDLLGIVTTHAPNLAAPAAESSAAVAREVIARVGPRSPPPVLAGSSVPLASLDRPAPGTGARFIVEVSRRFSSERRLALLAIGAATDVASALLLDPTLADRVEVVAMGFEAWPAGGDPWNVKNDPLAYRVLLGSAVPLTIGSGEICRRHLVLDAEKARAVTRGGGAAGEYLRGLLEDWLEKQPDLSRSETGRAAWPIWDLVTVAYLLRLARAEERPRPGLRDDLGFDFARSERLVSWITWIDESKLWKDLSARLERWALRVGP